MSSAVVHVHPLVLLNVVDHITRLDLSRRRTQPPSPSTPPRADAFLCATGVLMGTASVATSDGAVTTLTSSFELPMQRDESGVSRLPAAPSGDATFMTHLVESVVDWQAARQHREQLSAVMQESSVVGCYVVCSGVRSGVDDVHHHDHHNAATQIKKPRNETQQDLEPSAHTAGLSRIAQSFAAKLQQASLLPASADTAAAAASPENGFVLLLVYDGEVALRGVSHRLPFDVFWVALGNGAAPSTTSARAPPAVQASARIAPADMEWIGLANEATTLREGSGTTPTTPASKPGFLRRCSAALLPSTTTAVATITAVDTSSSPATPKALPAATATAARGRSAAEGLLSSLHVLARALDDAPGTTTAAAAAGSGGDGSDAPSHTPEDSTREGRTGRGASAELLRAVATCVRNVPHISTDPQSEPSRTQGKHPQQQAQDGDTISARASEDLLRAVLAMEAQCAMRLSALQLQQRAVVHARRSVMGAAFHRRALPSAQATFPSGKRGGAAVAVQEGHSEMTDSGAGGGWDAGRRDGRGRDPLRTVLKGHVWLPKE